MGTPITFLDDIEAQPRLSGRLQLLGITFVFESRSFSDPQAERCRQCIFVLTLFYNSATSYEGPDASFPCWTSTHIMSDCTYQSTRSAPRSDHGGPVDSHPAFTCTICWQRQARGSQPKLLGSSARIVCKPCWRAVLDLSICWVCGECIVRGDEVVSLGWCFWHRGCFGCLLCGTRLDVPARITSSVCSESGRRESDAKGEWSKWDGSANEADNRNTTRRSNTFRRFLRSPGLGLCLDGNANTLSRERRSPWWGTVLTILPSGRVWLWL